jgi:endoglucanase
LEGADWANDWSVFSQPFDDNLFYQFHYYCWDRPDNLKGIDQFLAKRDELNAPVWVGETGEKDDTIYWGTTQYFETNNIGWSFWPWKKMDTTNTPYSIKPPSGWGQIVAYSRGRTKPAPEVAQKAFDELIENIKLANCVYFPDVVNAVFRRIPGKIEAENYGHRGAGKSYSVKDTRSKARFYRTSEPVPVEPLDAGSARPRGGQCIKLSAGEWTAYEFSTPQAREFRARLRARADSLPAEFEVSCSGRSQTVALPQTGWNEIDLGSIDLAAGNHTATLEVVGGTVFFDWLQAE